MLSPTEHQKFKSYVHDVDVSRMAMAFDALGEPNRCQLFRALLRRDQVTVGQLAEAMELSQSLTSQHLKILLRADLIIKTRRGKYIYYSIKPNDPLTSALEMAVTSK